MGRLLAFGAANLSVFAFLLLILFIAIFVFFEFRERARMRRVMVGEIDSRVQEELGKLVGDILRRSEEAREQLAALGHLHSTLHEQRRNLEAQFASAKEQIEQLLGEVRSASGEVLKLAPTRSDLEWIAPGALLRLA